MHKSIGKKEFWSIDTIGGVIEIETFENISKIKIIQDTTKNIISLKLHRDTRYLLRCKHCGNEINVCSTKEIDNEISDGMCNGYIHSNTKYHYCDMHDSNNDNIATLE